MNIDETISIRELLPADTEFIYSTWLQGVRYSNYLFRAIPEDVFYPLYKKLVTKVLQKQETKPQIACLSDAPEVIVGYCIRESHPDYSTVHWVYVKKEWRKLGVASRIFPKDTKIVTHLTKVGMAVKPKNVVYNPFIV